MEMWAAWAVDAVEVGAILWVASTLRRTGRQFQERVSGERAAREQLVDRLTTKLHDHIKSPLHR